MRSKIKVKEKTLRRIKDSSRTHRRIEPDKIAVALGASEVNEIRERPSPISVFHLRTLLHERLQSKGGRPGLEGVSRRVKIPIADSDWSQLERLAAEVSSEKFAPSPGQVAGVLLSTAIEMIAHGKD